MFKLKRIIEKFEKNYTSNTTTITINGKVLSKEEADKHSDKFDNVINSVDEILDGLDEIFKDIENEQKKAD